MKYVNNASTAADLRAAFEEWQNDDESQAKSERERESSREWFKVNIRAADMRERQRCVTQRLLDAVEAGWKEFWRRDGTRPDGQLPQ